MSNHKIIEENLPDALIKVVGEYGQEIRIDIVNELYQSITRCQAICENYGDETWSYNFFCLTRNYLRSIIKEDKAIRESVGENNR